MNKQKLKSLSIALNDGTETTLGAVAKGAVLVVNVASACGFTKQYAALEALYESYRARGLEILGIPCNQFGGQEPGTDEEIAEFCQKNFGVTFPLGAKVDVNGTDAHPLFAELTGHGVSPVKWNFEKFLISADGRVLGRFASAVTPDAPKLVAAIEAALA